MVPVQHFDGVIDALAVRSERAQRDDTPRVHSAVPFLSGLPLRARQVD